MIAAPLRLAFACFGVFCAFTASKAFSLDSDRELAKCAVVKSSVDRLACYDDLAKMRDGSAPGSRTERVGNWNVTTETSKIDDSTNVFMRLVSENTFSDRYGNQRAGDIYIVCREHRTDLYIILGGMFLADSGGFGQVTVRIDRNKARVLYFSASTDHQALGLWRGAGVGFIKQMMNGKRVLFEVTPFNESAVTVEFEIDGLDNAIKPLRKACGW